MTTPTYRQLAETLAKAALADGYVQDALDGNWDPWGYRLRGGDLEFVRGRHDDSPEGLPLASELQQEILEEYVEYEVRFILAAAVEAAKG